MREKRGESGRMPSKNSPRIQQSRPGIQQNQETRFLHLINYSTNMGTILHCGLTGEWVQNIKGSYLLCFLHSALVFKARGQCDHHAFPLT